MLCKGTITKTGGAGSVSLESATKKPALTDALDSQSCLTTVEKNVFAVNASSNTLTMFEINLWDLTCLTMVSELAAIPGGFPVTAAASAKNNLVCVGTREAQTGTVTHAVTHGPACCT
ncbi:hypothetical protein E8E11_007535 [Didymella keratinophila]|nr:hypothetical protein E8E11_007535 [Didymella keratinophila]